MVRVIGGRSWRKGLGAGLALLAFTAAPAAATTVEVNSATLAVQGDNNDDAITISTDGTTLTVTDTGTGGATTADVDCTAVTPNIVTCPVNPPAQPSVIRFSVNLNDGIDSFVNQNFAGSFSSVGTSGDGSKTISAGPGDQLVAGGNDDDILDGGEGNDTLFDGGGDSDSPTGGNDLLNGGPGVDDTQYFRQNVTPLNISLDNVANDGQAGETDNVQVENVVAGNGNDVLTGNASANILVGAGGNDVVTGLGGNDELFGDLNVGGIGMLIRGIAASAGDDTLDGGKGRDSADCGRGFDLVLHDLEDEFESNCERTGAEVVGDSATVKGKKKNKFKVEILCPESEVAACSGKLAITGAGKKLGKGKFGVAAGKTKKSKAKLTKKGVKALRKAGGSLLVSVVATTEEPGGVSESSARILIHR